MYFIFIFIFYVFPYNWKEKLWQTAYSKQGTGKPKFSSNADPRDHTIKVWEQKKIKISMPWEEWTDQKGQLKFKMKVAIMFSSSLNTMCQMESQVV